MKITPAMFVFVGHIPQITPRMQSKNIGGTLALPTFLLLAPPAIENEPTSLFVFVMKVFPAAVEQMERKMEKGEKDG